MRTLVDAVYDWSRFGSLPRGYAWITRELAERRVKPAALVAATLRYGDLGTIRRMGALLEKGGVNAGAPAEARERAAGIDRHDSLDSHQPKRGTLDRRWGVIMNGEI